MKGCHWMRDSDASSGGGGSGGSDSMLLHSVRPQGQSWTTCVFDFRSPGIRFAVNVGDFERTTWIVTAAGWRWMERIVSAPCWLGHEGSPSGKQK